MAWRVFNGQRNWIYGYKDIALTNLKWGGIEFRKKHIDHAKESAYVHEWKVCVAVSIFTRRHDG